MGDLADMDDNNSHTAKCRSPLILRKKRTIKKIPSTSINSMIILTKSLYRSKCISLVSNWLSCIAIQTDWMLRSLKLIFLSEIGSNCREAAEKTAFRYVSEPKNAQNLCFPPIFRQIDFFRHLAFPFGVRPSVRLHRKSGTPMQVASASAQTLKQICSTRDVDRYKYWSIWAEAQ